MVFSWCSTGGMAVFRNLDWFTSKLAIDAPQATVIGAAFSGFYFYQYPYTGPGSRPVQDFSAAAFKGYASLHMAFVDESCAAALGAGAWACQQASGSHPYVRTPIFVAEGAGILCILLAKQLPSCEPSTACHHKFIPANTFPISAQIRPTAMLFKSTAVCNRHRGQPFHQWLRLPSSGATT